MQEAKPSQGNAPRLVQVHFCLKLLKRPYSAAWLAPLPPLTHLGEAKVLVGEPWPRLVSSLRAHTCGDIDVHAAWHGGASRLPVLAQLRAMRPSHKVGCVVHSSATAPFARAMH